MRHVGHLPTSLNAAILEVPAHLEHHDLVRSARQVLLAGRECAEKCRVIALTTLADPTATVEGAHVKTQERVSKLTLATLEQMQNTINRLHEKTTALTEFLKGPTLSSSAVGALLGMEVRAALMAMDVSERRKIVMQGIEANDAAITTSCLRCSPFLLGILPDEQVLWQQRWAAKTHPTMVEERDVLAKTLEHAERGAKLLISYTASLTFTAMVERATRLHRLAEQAAA